MNKKSYNIFFHLHTVSGIVISVMLYVIFFCGAFALFKEEIQDWESNYSSENKVFKPIDYDEVLDYLDKKYELNSRDVMFYSEGIDDKLLIYISPSQDTLAPENTKEYEAINLRLSDLNIKTYEENYHLGEFLYRLHFFNQLPIIGLYLAGLVSVFFLFAVITGIVIHWDKIIEFFYFFKPNSSLKRVWTDAHTALGTIGLPFQVIYAVTGAYFGLSILVLLPANFAYQSDQDKLIADLLPNRVTYDWAGKSEETPLNITPFITEYEKNSVEITSLDIKNYGGENMKYIIGSESLDKEQFVGTGIRVINAYTGAIEKDISVEDSLYTTDIIDLLGRLHFANFGGITVRIVYFIMALITAFVIISGVLIWLEARNRKNMTFAQRLYTAKIGHIYLAICTTLFPVTALSFIAVKFLPTDLGISRKELIYWIFFVLWFLFAIYYRFKRDNYITNKQTLLLGSIFGILVPVANGIASGNWIWTSYYYSDYDVLTIDLLWILLSVTAFIFYLKIKPSVKENSIFTKIPIDYKNRKKLLKEEKQNTI